MRSKSFVDHHFIFCVNFYLPTSFLHWHQPPLSNVLYKPNRFRWHMVLKRSSIFLYITYFIFSIFSTPNESSVGVICSKVCSFPKRTKQLSYFSFYLYIDKFLITTQFSSMITTNIFMKIRRFLSLNIFTEAIEYSVFRFILKNLSCRHSEGSIKVSILRLRAIIIV